MHSTTHIRPRSSNVNAMGWTMSGSPAKRVTLKPGGIVIFDGASFGGMGPSAASEYDVLGTEDCKAMMKVNRRVFQDMADPGFAVGGGSAVDYLN